MQSTAEVRWFYKSELPETTLHRFKSGELPQDKGTIEQRKDIYLYLPGVDSMGIKLRGKDKRQGNDADLLEIKRRQLEAGIFNFITGVSGRVEHWSKWVFHGESSDPQLSTSLTAEDEAWVSVAKVRYRRRYKVTSTKSVLAVPLTEWPANGCNVELTELVAPGGQAWWTLGLEAFGEADDTIEESLRLSANHFFARTGLGMFEEKDSYGYPRWLNVVTPSQSTTH
jgi:hypothetical protein